MKYYRLALPIPVLSLFTYSSEEEVNTGTVVEVEFRGKKMIGIVWEEGKEENFAIKPILKIFKEKLEAKMMKLAERLEEMYLHPRGLYAQLMLPPGSLTSSTRRFTPTVRGIFLSITGSDIEKAIIKLLIKFPYTKSYVRKKLGRRTNYYLKKLLSSGFLEYFEEERRKPLWSNKSDPYLYPEMPKTELNEEGKEIAGKIISSLGEFSVHLIFGITGSGKTFIAMKIIEEVLKKGGGVIYLVPEISMVPFPYQLLSDKFGKVEIIHSLQSKGMKGGSWERLRRGEPKIALGARSALFSPVKNLKLIVIDEEHDLSYAQETSPRYRAVETAIERGKIEGATVLLLSATPSVETFLKAKNGEFKLHRLTKRINDLPLPRAEIISMQRKKHLISDEFARALDEESGKGNQALVMLNRRGFSSYYYCPNCGYIATCPHCELPLTYHKEENYLECHYCGYREGPPSLCPVCGSEMKPSGTPGLQRLVESFKERFTDLKVERFDADIGRKKREARRILREFYEGKIDLIVGTQLISKGHNFPGVTLVGVFFPDILLNFPDFTASERTFQLITQMIGRAGRNREGRAMIQTYFPAHHAIKLAALQDYEGFFKAEIEFRKRLLYPPFVKLIRILMEDKDRKALGEKSRKVLNLLSGLRTRGPAMAPFRKIAGKWRAHIFVEIEKNESWEKFSKLYKESFNDFKGISIIVSPSQVL